MNSQPSRHHEEILIVDDTPANLRLLSQMLTSQGYSVRAVTSGARALESVRASVPSLILLDIRMPDMDGYEVCSELKDNERTCDIPVIFISALNEIEDKVKAFKLGGVDYITKPFQMEEVLARTETHLALRNLQKQLQDAIDKFERELQMAGKLQESFLPRKLPVFPDWDLAAKLLPANETSGDFYDVFEFPDGQLGIIVADVVDKGVEAALFMALCWGLIRTYTAEYQEELQQSFWEVNQRLVMDTGGDKFVTVFYGVLDPRDGRLTYCNAGQSPGLLVKAPDGESVIRLEQTGPPLGIIENQTWEQRVEKIDPGDMLVLYTDGITDAQNRDGKFFDIGGLLEVLLSNSGRTALEVHEDILNGVSDFVADVQQFDDIALFVVMRRG
ncbi:PP2C family protein-serine/threonine phosphatase [Chloroflexota bacterium]